MRLAVRREPGQNELIDDDGRRHAEGGHVGQGIELGAEAARAAKKAGNAAVEPVEHRREDDEADGHLPFARNSVANPEKARAKGQSGHRVREDGANRKAAPSDVLAARRPHWATPSIASDTPARATIVSPAITRWPSRS